MLDQKKGTRRVKFSDHQTYWEGWWHGWTTDEQGHLCAVIEHEGGSVSIESRVYLLQFVDQDKINERT